MDRKVRYWEKSNFIFSHFMFSDFIDILENIAKFILKITETYYSKIVPCNTFPLGKEVGFFLSNMSISNSAP